MRHEGIMTCAWFARGQREQRAVVGGRTHMTRYACTRVAMRGDHVARLDSAHHPGRLIWQGHTVAGAVANRVNARDGNVTMSMGEEASR